MKSQLFAVVAAVVLHGAAALLSDSSSRTCPGGLRMLRTVALPSIQNNSTGKAAPDAVRAKFLKDPYVLQFHVAEVQKVEMNLGPSLKKGVRYLLFDEKRKFGLRGSGCVVEGMVRCKSNPPKDASTASASKSECGTPCEQDFHNPELPYVRAVLGAARTALASTHTKEAEYQPKTAAVIGVGAGTMAGSLLTAYPNAQVDAVDLEDGVLHAALECFGLGLVDGAATRLHTHIQDGVAFLKAQPKSHYDVMIFDVAPSPPHFAFVAQLVNDLLAPGGVVALNGWKTDTVFSGLVGNLTTMFPSVWMAPVGYGNEVSFAAKGKLTDGFPRKLTGVPPEAAKWFREFHWKAVRPE